MVAKKSLPHSWYEDEIVLQLIRAEKKIIDDILPTLYGYHLVFVGEPGLASLTDSSLITHRIIVNEKKQGAMGKMSYLQGTAHALPLRSESVDVIVLSHTLEHADNPHEVLREAHRVLIPEGHLVMTGFNPFSLWGIWHAWKQFRGAIPPEGHLIMQSRIRDWLALLNFQIVKGNGFYFRPPLSPGPFNDKLLFLESWGQKCWPFCAGAYTLSAIKRVVPLTPVRARWRIEKRLWQGARDAIPKPTTTAQQYHDEN